MHWRMDAAVTVDAQNAPTATWKTAQNAVSHSAHAHHRQRALHTKNLTLPWRQKLASLPMALIGLARRPLAARPRWWVSSPPSIRSTMAFFKCRQTAHRNS